jgi:thiol-disulfide isomerase/thioredoxin
MNPRNFRALRPRRELLAAVVSVLVIVGGVAAFASPGRGEEGTPRARTTSGERATIGEAAPNFAVPTLDGDLFELAAVRGQPVWINVWASWCPPCRAEMPDIDEVRRRSEADGLAFVAMNFGEDPADVANYLRNTGYDFAVGIDVEGEFARLYNVLGLPMHIFIAADGTLDSLRVGGMSRAEMDEKVAELTAAAAAARLAP